jgi:hypothetical protein
MPKARDLAVLLLLALASVAGADERPDSPEPPRPGSPRAVVITFFQSFSDGNAKALRDSVLTDSDEERNVADGMAQVVAGVAAARKAIVTKFKVRDQDLNIHVIPVEVFNGMTEKVDEDSATLEQDGQTVVVLKKISGAWKIALGELLKQGGKTIEQTLKELHGSIQRVEQVARDVESGKFTSADEAAKAVSEAVPSRDEPVQ